jgi:peptidoglycan-N-acetylglucosamine deacetylase
MSRYYIVSTIFLLLLISSLIIDGALDVPLYWYIGLTAIYLGISTMGSIILSMQYFTTVISSGNSSGVALSFDDGPIPGKTDKLLEILRQYEAPAAFFCIGKRISENPELVKRIHGEGHVIGNHSYFHKATFDLQSSPMIAKELSDTDNALQRIIGERPRFFRPPFGVTNPMVARAVKRKNYKVIGWSIRSFDTVIHDRKKLFQRVTKPLKAGDILLFHDHCESMLEILPDLLEHIRKSGLKVVRIDEMINENAYV